MVIYNFFLKTYGRPIEAINFLPMVTQAAFKGVGVKAKTKKMSRFTTDFHSESSVSETKGRMGVKVYIF